MKVAVVAHAAKTLGAGLPALRRALAKAGVEEPLWYEVPKAKKAPGQVERALDAGAEPTALSGEVPTVPSKLVEESEVRAAVRAEIGKLPDREKLVLSLYYDDGLTLAQIARVIGVSESRVPQLHSKSVLHLRTRLTAAGLA